MKIILSCLIKKEIKDYFSNKGIEVIPTMPFSCENSVIMHPDIQCFYDNGIFFTYPDFYDYYKNKFKNIVVSEKNFNAQYPNDVLFNCFKAENYVFCNTDFVDKTLLSHLKKHYSIVNVNQGYSNCSCLYLGKNCVATSDNGMEIALKNNGFNVIKIDNQNIKLKGYKNGFIGGSAINLKNEIIFFGNVEPYNNITEFLLSQKITYTHSPFPLEDFGSGIVI